MTTVSAYDALLTVVAPFLIIDTRRWPDKHKRYHADCPFCTKPTKPGQTHFAISAQIGAYYCQVCQAHGKLSDLARHLGIDPTPYMHKNGTSETLYDYTDENGALLYQNVRYYDQSGAKHFYVRQPNGSGGWIKSITNPPVRRVLYCLPEIIEAIASDEVVFIVEGEKDVNTLRLYGLTATTNIGGAGKWLDEYDPVFVGAHVIILPDNDTPGQAHAETIKQHLTIFAASIQCVNLPGLAPKGDVSDWLNGGNTISDLLALIGVAPAQTAPPPAPPPRKTNTPPTSKSKKRISTTYQTTVATLQQLGYSLRWNEVLDRIEVNGVPIDDHRRAIIHSELSDFGLTSATAIDHHIDRYAEQYTYHPIKEYLERLVWNGCANIERLISYFTITGKNKDLFYPYFRKFAIGAVNRAYTGEHHPALSIGGEQRIGKTTFVRWLMRNIIDYFTENAIDLRYKQTDANLNLARYWIWEIGELDKTMRTQEQEQLKHFLSREHITERASYGRYNLNKPALASFIGTFNPSDGGIYSDLTGSRRFVTVTVEKIDFAYSMLDPDQIWAEAMAAYISGERWELSTEEFEESERNNQQYYVPNTFEDTLRLCFVFGDCPPDENGALLDDEPWLPNGDVYTQLVRYRILSTASPTRAQMMQIADALRKLGCEAKKKNNIRGWTKIQLFPAADDMAQK